MKNLTQNIFTALALLALLTLNPQLSTCFAQGTAFTYQGQLQNNGSPASGTYNLQFSLYATNNGVTSITGPITVNGVLVTNGLFTVSIDFGSSVWNGQTNWLQIGVETNGASPFASLSPRQQLTPVPYAIFAESSSNLSGTLSASQLTSIGNNNGGTGNFFVGPSGNSTMSDGGNTAIGVGALTNDTSGSGNTANGQDALAFNTIGKGNTANGWEALLYNTNGFQNTADGADALAENTSGSYNTADGFNALYDNTSGSNNIALGYDAGFDITTGNSNIDIGNAGFSSDNNIIRIGSGQTATYIAGAITGNGGGLTNLSASQLTSIGNNNGGTGNFFVGPSGNSTMSDGGNTAIGVGALTNDTSGSGNTANGQDALAFNTIGKGNTANGWEALLYNTNGFQNTADGADALAENTSGSYNTADGFNALYENTSGSNNIALGYDAGFDITTGNSNIDIGSPGVSTDNNIIRIGTPGIQTSTFIAGVIVANGGGLTNLNAAKLTSIGNNNFFAGLAGNAANTGSDNTAIGFEALTNNTSGTGSTAFGFGALQNATGNFNFGYGYLAGSGITSGANNVDIAAAGLSSDSAIIRIGTQGIQGSTYIAGISGATAASGVEVYVNSSGQLGTLTSSARFKRDIQSMDKASDVLLSLHPVTFKYKPEIDPQGIPQFGLVAEDVEKVDPDLVAHDNQGKIYTVRYQAVDAMLLNEFLKQHQTVEEQNAQLQGQSAEIADLKKQNVSLAQRLDELEQMVKKLAERN